MNKNSQQIKPARERNHQNWYEQGYRNGYTFSRFEADYDELAAIYRVGWIPSNWDLFRAELLNHNLDKPHFDFQAYAAGFTQACIEFFETI